MYLKNGIDFEPVEVSKLDKCNILGVHLSEYRYNIYSIYRAPNNDKISYLHWFSRLLEENKNSLIVDDINLNVLDNYSYTIQNKNMFTRKKKHREGTNLDHVITPKCISCQVRPKNIIISDHKMLMVTAKLNKHKPLNKTNKITT
ncbi:hypothetical protein HHI36_010754 [Cryptolaemus montrouzieri]|uniref:Uncharacterized protein n=1 Tax=Cryptolaemus montrouzieri TaxID=559131 RepID=A0ABD2MJW7_9CUCU